MAPPAVNKARPIPIIQGKEILSLERELGIIQFISYQLSVISYQLSVISYQLSVISYQLSVISYQLSVISYQSNAFILPISPPPHFIIHNS
ncbi:MAG: hypothetical protein EWV55_09490 [Microcystis viridis Mv_BB_P_19951000_S69]|nr:MAG: hypothetical protein EWV55_09490 [Microcystis viridis Mv_BB_P_19951000_S69]